MIASKRRLKKPGLDTLIGGLLGESERKNLTQIADNAIGVVYNRLHHCLDAVAHGGNPQDRAASLLNRCPLVRESNQ
ncbi:hypothetical protein LYNGBM3L_53040 [Moorena producens 3L]|uniref:Uncharacterized protein n=1 Tax=Moorena producens 3L TaxID=489825 RepID=F4XYW7_9CYAN|nr:hypothetical protein LYNGBM3L_53040 [Moorena producens 3L]